MAKYKAESKAKRELREQHRQEERRKRVLTWGGLGLLGLVLVGGLIWFFASTAGAAAAATGEIIPVTSRDHVPDSSDPGPYSTNPPAEGQHFLQTFNPGFYTPEDVAKMPRYPEGYLVHNLEHGYIIYWYNCAADPNINCANIQNAIKQVIQEKNSFKVIGFPWPSQEEPLVMTSWGRILRQDRVNLRIMRAFYDANVNKGPEITPN
ncbi:MAG: DUF3105 domain-containing protein [Chloroflexi bacterium]|nr:MAG: DUF3105 domain-containing protein [Chloroflexota bacterium]